jgi:diguanylate cyclase (GGDEF)-like protein
MLYPTVGFPDQSAQVTQMENTADQSEALLPDSERGYPPTSRLYSLLGRLRLVLRSPFNARAVWQLRQQIEHQSSLARQAEAALAGALAGAEIFEKASVAARMGFWQCELPSQRLTWSNGTYNLFGLQRSSGIVRSEILRSYSEESLALLERVRSNAIDSGSGFGLDAEIRHPGAGKRWIRISATVERRNGEPVRLFGVKQDITEEKKQLERMEYLAGHDAMTSLANRSQFEARLARLCEPGAPGGALMLIDLDGFKEVNDNLGHAAGDACLIEIAGRLSTVCRSAELIARIGGDEFAVLLGPGATLQKVEDIAQRIVRAAEAPMSCAGRLFRIGASVGYAFTERQAPATVFTRADRALYAAKAAGRRSAG